MRSAIAAVKVAAYLTLTILCIPVQWFLLRVVRTSHPYAFPQWYHRICCRIFRMKVQVEGQIEREGHVVFISNHVSYLDIPIIASVVPTAFVAKRDVDAWPFFGTLARLQRTHMISRAPADADKEKNAFIERLKEPLPLVLFAEGTNSLGGSILPFKSSMFEVFLNKNIKLQPLTISVLQVDEKQAVSDAEREIFAWGDVEIPEHLWRFSKGKGCVIKLTFHKPLLASSYNDRKLLSNDAYKSVTEGLDFSDAQEYGLVQNSR